jgi:hypothetical protein
LVLAMLILPRIGLAQKVAPTPPDSGCYVPRTGVVYVLNEPMSPTDCFSPAHIKFAWQAGESAGAAATRTRSTSQNEMAGVRADLFKWMLFFWIATLVILGGLIVLLLRRQART